MKQKGVVWPGGRPWASLWARGQAAQVRLGNAAGQARRWREAEKLYAAALALRPDRPGVLVQYGHALKEQGFLPEATAAYLRAVRLEPLNADTHLQIGHVMQLQGDHARAIAAYEAAHRLDPGIPHGRQELANLRRETPDAVAADLHLEAQETTDLGDAALLRAARLGDAFLPLFDPFFYYQANPAVRTVVQRPDRLACLQHFCAEGAEALLPFAPDLWFDADFYRDNYLSHLSFTPANAYRHWLTTGVRQGAAPNQRAWLRARLGVTVDSLDGIDLALLATRLGADRTASWVAQVECILASAGNPSAAVAITELTAGLFAALADRMEAERGDTTDAFRLRQMIAHRVPGQPANQRKLAEALAERDNLAEATRLYRTLPAAARSPDSFRRLATCEERLGQPEAALQTLVEACSVFPDSEALRRERLEAAERLFGHAWELGMAQARLDRVADGRKTVGTACDTIIAALTTSASSPAPRTIRRVALAGHAPLPQCAFYRIDQTAELLRLAGLDAEVFDLCQDTAAFHAALHGFDAVIFCRVPAVPGVITAIAAARAFGLVTYYDMDDLIFDPVYPNPLDSYGGLISRDEHAGLALAVPLFDRAMRLCRYGIASTASLAEAMRTRVISGEVFIRPNVLSEPHRSCVAGAQAGRADDGRTITLFYGSGGKAHKNDFAALVEPALVALVVKYGKRVRVVLVGDFPQTPALSAIAENLTVLPAIRDLNTYWSVLAQADINLAVLLPDPTTDAKSAIKWLEAAMLGIPSVVSDTATYRAVVRPGETGIMCATSAQWTAALDRLVGDAALRRRIGEQARAQALAQYGAEQASEGLRLAMQAAPAREPRPLVVVAHVFYPPQAVGGATRVVADNVRDVLALAGDRLDIEVFSSLDGGAPYEVSSDAQDGVRVTRVGTPDVEKLEYRAVDDRMGEIFGAYLDRARPALVHFHCIQRLTTSIVAAAASRGIPYLVTVHDGWWISDHQFLLDADGQQQTYDMARPVETLRRKGIGTYERLISMRQALFGAERVLAVSAPFAAIYEHIGVPRVMTVANGVPDLLADATAPARLRRPDGKVRLGFIGGLARHKGYDLVRIAVAARPWQNLVLLLIDHALPQGSIRHEMWGSVAVEVQARWPQADVATLYAQIDVLLAPSLWPESFGLVTREAIAAGCYVVASDRGSVGDCVEDGRSGFIVDVSSPDGLVAALARIDADPARFLRPPPPSPAMRGAREQARDLVALYETILSRQPPGPAT